MTLVIGTVCMLSDVCHVLTRWYKMLESQLHNEQLCMTQLNLVAMTGAIFIYTIDNARYMTG